MSVDAIDFAFQTGKNCLLVGPHGVGKTNRPISIFKETNTPYLFFNCPTMDVYEDFRGIPVVKDDKVVYVKPGHVDWQNAEYILLDEPNRAHVKVVGSLYELIQFGTINGYKLPKLKAVWATMNPDDGEYTVETLDQSFIDRFHVVVNVKPELKEDFFLRKFAKNLDKKKFEMLLHWWQAIPPKERTKNASPRRVEYAVSTVFDGGLAEFSLPSTVNPRALDNILKNNHEAQSITQETSQFLTTDQALTFINDQIRTLHNASTNIGALPTKDEIETLAKIPKEVFNARFSKATIPDNEVFVSKFYNQIDFFNSCPSLLISMAKTRRYRIPTQSRIKAGNLLVDNFPRLAHSLNIIKVATGP